MWWAVPIGAVSLLLLFYILKWNDSIADMPGEPLFLNIKWEHAWGILLLILPAPFEYWVFNVPVYALWGIGFACYCDDLYQHYRITYDPSYKSPLHLWGWWYLRPWLNKHLRTNIY